MNVDKEIDSLKQLVTMLLRVIRKTNAGVEALRLLLEQRRVFSDAEFDAMLEKALKMLDDDFGKQLQKAMANAHDSALLEILQKHEGKPQ